MGRYNRLRSRPGTPWGQAKESGAWSQRFPGALSFRVECAMARKPAGSSPMDDEMRRLYRLPLGEFTAVRNALAKQLQKKGEGDAANEVKALPKPSVSAWAVNQLFEREADRMRSLL